METRKSFVVLFKDIRFWIILFFVIRLFHISAPPLEIGHSWRQALTNMIARNFFEGKGNLLYPHIDMAGEKSGIIGSEFPFFNYLIYMLAQIFGYQHWYGRIINLIVSSFGLFYFYKLVEGLFSKKVAFFGTFVLSLSIWFGFSRKIMPDTFSVSLVIIGLYFAFKFLKAGSYWSLVWFFLFTTLGILCKIPAMTLFTVIGVVPFLKFLPSSNRWQLICVSTICVGIVSLWYFYWVPHLVGTYGFALFFPKGIVEGYREFIPLISQALKKFYFSSLYSYVAFASFIGGVYFFIRDYGRAFHVSIALITITFLIFILKTGEVFPTHNYYIIPFTPVMALMAGILISKLNVKFAWITITLIAIESIANQQHDFQIKNKEKYKLTLEQILSENTDPDELIVLNSGQSPQQMYFAHRKGWSLDDVKLQNKAYLDSLMTLGPEYLIVDLHYLTGNYNYPMIYGGENYRIYTLKSQVQKN